MRSDLKGILTRGNKLLVSQTAKDTALVMIGNVISGLTGLGLAVLVARFLSVADFGTFSSLMYLTLIIVALVDLGMTQGVVNFIPTLLQRKKNKKINQYLGTMVVVVLGMGILALIILQLLPESISFKISGTSSKFYLLLAGLAVITLSFYPFFLGVFQAFRLFLARTISEVTFCILRVGLIGLLILTGLTIGKAILAYILGALICFLVIWRLWPTRQFSLIFSLAAFKKIFKFSRWLWGVNMIINIYGKIDVLILTVLTSSLVVAQYAAAARLALVFPMSVAALNAVVAPRFASFSDKKADTSYMKKTFLLTLGIASGLMIFVIIAKPLILMVYGPRYSDAIDLFRILVLANFPFILALPATNSIVYFSKKPSVITGISFLQLIVMATIAWTLTPLRGAFAPIYGFLAANLLGVVLIYSFWFKFHFEKSNET